MRDHVAMVDPPAPVAKGTTVRAGADESPPRGTGWGLGLAVLAIGLAVSFRAGLQSPVETAVHVVAAQAGPAEAGAPGTTPDGRPLAAAAGVAFPDLSRRLGWRPVGRRDDLVDGRRVATVQYGRAGRRLAYSVVDGPPLAAPPGATRVSSRGAPAVQFEAAGRVAAMRARDGRSVVASGAGLTRAAVVRAVRAR